MAVTDIQDLFTQFSHFFFSLAPLHILDCFPLGTKVPAAQDGTVSLQRLQEAMTQTLQ